MSSSSVPVMFDDTFTLWIGSSLPAPLTDRVIEARATVADCTAVGGCCRGFRLPTARSATSAMITPAKIQRPIVIFLQLPALVLRHP